MTSNGISYQNLLNILWNITWNPMQYHPMGGIEYLVEYLMECPMEYPMTYPVESCCTSDEIL